MSRPWTELRLAYLADHSQHQAELRRWFETEWADYYGPQGPGDAAADLAAFAQRERLPLGLIALHGNELCGIAALKGESIASRRQFTPWAAAGLVRADLRGQGIGAQLIAGLVLEARRLGYARLYCATATAHTLLRRGGWQWRETLDHDGHVLGLYEIATTPASASGD